MKQMRYSRRLLAAAALIIALGVGAFGVSATLAAENDQGEITTLVEAIAERFDVKVADVQAVFDEHREQLQAKHEEKVAERLQTAVDDGKITQEQADLITEKREEIRDLMESLKDESPSDRQEAMKSALEDVREWAEDNEIPLYLVMPEFPKPGHHRMQAQQ